MDLSTFPLEHSTAADYNETVIAPSTGTSISSNLLDHASRPINVFQSNVFQSNVSLQPCIAPYKCYLLNAQCLHTKANQFNCFISNHLPDLVFVTETWLNEDQPDGIICPPHYYCLRKDRRTPGGGLAVFVRVGLHAQLLPVDDQFLHCEILPLEISSPNATGPDIRFILTYRPPYYSPDDLAKFTLTLHCIELLLDTPKPTAILGDFNLPLIDWVHFHAPDSPLYNLFMKLTHDYGLSQFVLEPTRINNILDLILSPLPDFLSDYSICPPLGTSDHDTICFAVNTRLPNVTQSNQSQRNKAALYYDFASADYEQINALLLSIDWVNELSLCHTVDEYWSLFIYHLSQAIDIYVPVKSYPPKRARCNRYPKFIRVMLTRKAALWRRQRTLNTPDSLLRYQTYASKCAATINEYHASRELRLIEQNNVGSFYKFVNGKLGQRNVIHPIRHPADNSLISSPAEQAALFNAYFASVFTRDDGDLPEFPPRVGPHIRFADVQFTPAKVSRFLCSLKSSSTSGPDGITNSFLKGIASAVAFPLSIIFQFSFNSHSLPAIWLQAFVCPIFKKGSTADPSNYRPISLTSVCCRVMERMLNLDLLDYLSSHKLISPRQHGFLKRRSTCTNLIESLRDWSLALRDKYATDIVYIDFKKAFDSVSHPKLLCKLSSYGISGNALLWITAFLSNRLQAVKIADSISSFLPVTSGVPQGTVLGPTLFLIFINDVADIFVGLHTTLQLYADDIKLHCRFRCDLDLQDLDTALSRLVEWATVWQLPIAVPKCSVHQIMQSNSFRAHTSYHHIYHIGSTPLPLNSLTRDLGLTLDKRLNFSLHISKIAHAAHTRSKLILKCFTSRSPALLVRAFTTYVRPLVEYCSSAWSPHFIQDIKAIESVQRRFTKRLFGFFYTPYINRLEMLGLKSLQYRRISFDLIFCYKIIYGLVDLECNKYFLLKGASFSTRGHPLHIIKQHVRVDQCKYFFSNRITDVWNSLPHSVIEAITLSQFKSRLARFDLYPFCTNT